MPQEFERKEVYSTDHILSLLPNRGDLTAKEFKKFKLNIDGDMMKMTSDRYYTFAKSLHCDCCGIVGKFFAKDRDKYVSKRLNNDGKYHFNLYGIDDKSNEVLMTKDHIVH